MPLITELHLFPVKSCAGIALREATLTTAGLMTDHIYDREWMVVDTGGIFLTQRTHPRMALITPRIKADTLELRAPGMMRLEIPLGLPDPEHARMLPVQVWDDRVAAYDCDDTTAAWFSNAIGTPCRLARFHPGARRVADRRWTQGVEAPTLFSDGFPLLVISEASLEDLNARLRSAGSAPLSMNRFRPNIVIDGVGPFEEDYAESLRVGNALLRPVKPCARCAVPAINPSTGIADADPLETLKTYRMSEALGGGIAFGMNTVVLQGEGQRLQVGQEVSVTMAFHDLP